MINIARPRTTSLGYKNLILSVLKEKSSSLLIGALVIIIAIVFGWLFLTNQTKPTPSKLTNQTTPKLDESVKPNGTYLVKEGDNLWKIAESTYGSGYNFIDIAKANNIVNPDFILIGQSLRFPVVVARIPTKGDIISTSTAQVTFKGSSYSVKTGDYLWKIALEAYGDGYGWTRIANANNLNNPDLIYPNSKLTIPR